MKKVYLIEKLITRNGKLYGHNAEYEIIGYVSSKVKAEELIRNGRPIEKIDPFGNSYIPKQIVNEYKVREVSMIQ